MATLKLEIVTPGAKIFEGQVESVLLPGTEGEMGVLPQHEPLITQLDAGEVRYVQQGRTQSLAIGEGFAEITGDSVGILTDVAVEEKEIDEKVAEAAVKRAEDLLKTASLQGEELEATQASLARSLAQLHVKRRRRG
ncbi:MAG: ATP synthase F1 subunit epsilon [Acetobacteraceae bacterium]